MAVPLRVQPARRSHRRAVIAASAPSVAAGAVPVLRTPLRTLGAAAGSTATLERPSAPTSAPPQADPRPPMDGTRRPAAADDRRSWARSYARRLAGSDVVALVWAAVGAHALPLTDLVPSPARPVTLPLVGTTVALLAVWLLALAVTGSRDRRVVGYGPEEYRRVVVATLAVFGLAAIASYLLRLDLPRSSLVVMMPAGLAALLVSRFIWRRWLRRTREGGGALTRVLAVGDEATVRELVRDLRRAPQAGYAVVGVCVPTGAADPTAPGPALRAVDGVPVVGSLQDVPQAVARVGADTVAVTATAAFGPSRVRQLSWELEAEATELVLAPALTDIAGPRVHTRPVAGLPLIHVDRPTYGKANWLRKRAFDVVVSSLLLVLAGPVLLVLAAAVRVTSSGPALFRQERVGQNGSTFRMIKFRSMVADAEARLAELQTGPRDAGNEVLFKIKDDPRITPLGRVLRRYSLDELPQLINVLKGEMSLVGPRPPLAAEVDRYEPDARRRLLVRPGMTGLWQVSGRSDLSWSESVRLDVYYVENWSVTGDLAILAKTARAALGSSGAY